MKKSLLMMAIAAILLTACYEYPDSDGLVKAKDQLITVTHIDESYDFHESKFFYVTDSIIDVKVDALGNETVKTETAGPIRETIIENMEAYGYTLIDSVPDALSDFVLYFDLVYAETENIEVTTYGYGWWYDYYYPYYWGGGYYPVYYPTYNYYTSYESKMLIVNCNTLKTRTTGDETLQNRWLAIVRGVDDLKLDEALVYLDQAFVQSPELKIN